MEHDDRPHFAGIYKHHGGVKMRDSSLARGQEITRDFIIENVATDSSSGNDSDASSAVNGSAQLDENGMERVSSDADSDHRLSADGVQCLKGGATQNHINGVQQEIKSERQCSDITDKSLPSSLNSPLLAEDARSDDHMPSNLSSPLRLPDDESEKQLSTSSELTSNDPHEKCSISERSFAETPVSDMAPIALLLAHQPEAGSPTSDKSLDSYEEVQPLTEAHTESPQEDTLPDSPVGFSKEVSSSELESLSSPSDNFLYGEIEKSLDSSRDDLITESIELSVFSTDHGDTAGVHKPRKFSQIQRHSVTSPEGTLEVTGILKDLDKASAVDTGGMLVGYGYRPRNDEDDEGLAGIESRQSTPSGYHSDTTETRPKQVLPDCEDYSDHRVNPWVAGPQGVNGEERDDSLGANGSVIGEWH